MFWLSLKLSVRHLLKQKTNSGINIFGLSLALSVCLLIFSYVHYHLNFDKHILDYENTYRIISNVGDANFRASTFGCYADAFEDVSAVKDKCFFVSPENAVLNIENQTYTIEEFAIADSGFFSFFNLELLSGTKRALNNPNTAFLSEGQAQELFPDINPIGKQILVRSFRNHQGDSLGFFTIAGVYKDMPKDSHFGADLLLSKNGNFSGFINHVKSSKMFGARVYLKFYEGANIANLEAELTQRAELFLKGRPGPPVDAFRSKFQPLRDIHLDSGLILENRQGVKKSFLFILFSIGVLVFIIALINFANILIAQGQAQKLETGIYKTLGANRQSMFINTITDVLLPVLLSALLSVIIVLVAKPFSIGLLGFSSLNLNLSTFLLILLTLTSTLIISTGLISYFSSRHTNVKELLKDNKSDNRGMSLTATLSIFQIAVVIFMLSLSMIIFKQIRFIDDKDLGYSPENVMVVDVPKALPRGNVVKEEIENIAGVLKAGTAHHHPAYNFQTMNVSVGKIESVINFGFTDTDCYEALGMQFTNLFTKSLEDCNGGWIINETFYKELRKDFSEEEILADDFFGMKDARGNDVKFNTYAVVKDFHYQSLHAPLENFAYIIRQPENSFNRFLLVRFSEIHGEKTIEQVTAKLEELFPGHPVKYSFLDDKLHQQYQSEKQLSMLIQTFSVVAVIIACLGLLGFSILSAHRRIKEIGVRKVNGARSSELITMLAKKYVLWVFVAFCVAVPVAVVFTNMWLQDFAYRTALSCWVFVLAGLTAMIISLITVSWQSWRAANRNPVEALKYE